MGIDGMASRPSVPEGLPLAETYRLLDARRIEIDRTMISLTPDDPARDELWQELESVLEKLREVVGKLAKSPATDWPELRVKAAILARLLRQTDDGASPAIPEPERLALALSLTEDVARLPDG
jgi:hypothetical protein